MRTEKAINEFLQNRHASNLKPASIEWYRVLLQPLASVFSTLPEEPGPIEEFLSQATGSPETKHGRYRVLNVFFKFIKERWGISNPMQQIAPPRRPKKVLPTLESHEVMLLLNSATNARDRAMLTLLIDTGIRSGELAGLRKSDIKRDTIRVSGKTGEREVPISEETRHQLVTLIADNGAHDYVFHGHKGPLGRHGIYGVVSKYMTKAGVQGPKLGAHRIRHTFGKGYLVNGGDLRSLQEILGHANISTTQKYASLNLNDVITKHHRFTPLRAAHAAAQESFFNTGQALNEAEAILREANHGS